VTPNGARASPGVSGRCPECEDLSMGSTDLLSALNSGVRLEQPGGLGDLRSHRPKRGPEGGVLGTHRKGRLKGMDHNPSLVAKR
jgi:hypothetical protein